ncbi:xanthine dehydrogenase family protein molybdopterin-binding subunit [Sphingomonas sp. JC676]|uniref:xanthine dehydrogenase family protein molybdopterin-binding subunit n=1 Tax=Sphingomonas sp. JC676 TaxID=2768065 RepID=UPI0016585E17|nr:molybdopterin cofactor-binding domain-containing protein [Sphingomonas sp. JC676]MBC9033987.1 xanthine dehydrogenase family protein molybdopterin-binding subunit [Sphingomonas sp. JC676]
MATSAPVASRRVFLGGSAALVGELVIGFGFGSAARAAGAGEFRPNAFLRLAASGEITVTIPCAEMGQGAVTGLAQLVAEELEVPVERIRTELAPGDDIIYANPLLGGQITGGSASVRGGWKQMRGAGAAARTVLIEAAAKQWSVPPDSCRAEAGEVVHPASGRRLAYAKLVDAASRLPVPKEPKLKTGALSVIGKPVPRLDTPAKVNGSAKFGIDVSLPGMRHAAVANSPIIGGRLESVDEAPALAVKGVRQVVKLDNAVAVIADHGGAARKGLAALSPRWSGSEAPSTASMVAAYDAAMERQGVVAERKGDAAQALAAASGTYEAVYRLPMLAHVALEPINCTVSVKPDWCELWLGSQVPGRARKAAAAAAGLPLDKVKVNSFLIGGGFGRKLEVDFVPQAVAIGRAVGAPVKIVWGRDEDIRNDAFRYHNHSRVRVGLDQSGMPVSWDHKLVAPGVMFRFLPGFTKDGVDLDDIDDAATPYTIPHILVEYVREEPPKGLLAGNWRGVGATRNAVIVEGVIDELAHRAKRDPLEYRRAMIDRSSRLGRVLDRVADESGWGQPLAPRHGRGIAIVSAFGSHIGMVAEVALDPQGAVTVTRLTCAIDTGYIVNPNIVRQQIEGGIVFGLGAVFYGEVTVARGRVLQTNYHDCRVLRMNEMPEIRVALVDSTEDPGGVGEPGTSLVAPAVLNAIRAAGGPRLTSLPLPPAMVHRA